MRLTRYFYVSCTKCGIDRDMLYQSNIPRLVGDTFTTADSRKHCSNCKGADFILVAEVKPDKTGYYWYEIICTSCHNHNEIRTIKSPAPYNFKQVLTQGKPCSCVSMRFEVIKDLNIVAPATNIPTPYINHVSGTIVFQQEYTTTEEEKFLQWVITQDTTGALESKLLLSFEDRHSFYKKWELLAYVREIFPNIWKRYNQI